MKTRKITVWLVALAAVLLTACKTELDMRDLDATAQFDMGLSLPIGSMKMTLEDVLGLTPASGYIKYEEDGTLYYDGNFDVSKEFHPVDITDKSSGKEDKHLHLTDYYTPGTHSFTKGMTMDMDFDVSLKLNNVNNNLEDERIDKLLIKTAVFESKLTYRSDYGGTSVIPASWIKRIDIVLSDQFERAKGMTVNLYNRQTDSPLQYDNSWPTGIDEFTMCLTSRPDLIGKANLAEMSRHTLDTIGFKIHVELEAQDTREITIDDNSAWDYSMHLGMLEYRAVWGLFSPSNKVRDEGVLVLADEWSGWKELGQFRLPLYDPVVNLRCVTQVAGQFMVKGQYLYVEEEKSGEKRYAQFDANGRQDLEKIWPKEECLDINSTLGDSVALNIQFSKAATEGQIDKLFEIHPDKIGYEFRVDFANKEDFPFARITDNTNINMHINVHTPLAFNEGLQLDYGDTIRDLNLGIFNKDSLKKHVEWIDSIREGKVYLALMIENTLPMDVDGTLLLLDKMGQRVTYKDSTGQDVFLQFWGADTLHISAPKYDASGEIIEPGKCATTHFYVNADQLEALSRVNQIYFHAAADDRAIKALQKQNPDKAIYPLRIKKDAALRIRLGVAAKAGAIFDFNNLLDKEK